ncbi:VanZ family protein [Salinisphaera sp.]|uniref:VanZ family protein n=1 Tax=Salinisphaera sp. TaxID=1914330 RepID=UPI000C514D0E|nr:VanZ family protein [Salinisphaera sp.]MAS09168.1 hypothetical protein [Salinisphaera sp.]|tara:strand:- start:1120 stop:1524 length:405 start_codon:yes stop_codon:yes gene_type:complete
MSRPERGYRMFRVWMTLGFFGCAILFYACLMPSPPTLQVSNFDKIEHFAAFGILGAWFAAVLAPRYLLVFVGLAVFGVVIELVQAATTYRSGDPWDFLADGIGLVAGILFARIGGMDWLRYIDQRVAAARNRTK